MPTSLRKFTISVAAACSKTSAQGVVSLGMSKECRILSKKKCCRRRERACGVVSVSMAKGCSILSKKNCTMCTRSEYMPMAHAYAKRRDASLCAMPPKRTRSPPGSPPSAPLGKRPRGPLTTVRKSRIANAGYGVFALEEIDADKHIVMYAPDDMTFRKVFNADGNEGTYSQALTDSRAYASVLQKANPHSVVRFCNHVAHVVVVEDAHTLERKLETKEIPFEIEHGYMCNSIGNQEHFLAPKTDENAEFYTINVNEGTGDVPKWRVAVKTVKPIEAGAEIILNYGIHEYGTMLDGSYGEMDAAARAELDALCSELESGPDDDAGVGAENPTKSQPVTIDVRGLVKRKPKSSRVADRTLTKQNSGGGGGAAEA